MKHIDELRIDKFRGLRDLKIEGLGQVNLFVGNNDSGKTSVLEALSPFCDPFNWRSWYDVGSQRDSLVGSSSGVDRITWLFAQGADPKEERRLSISASGNTPLWDDMVPTYPKPDTLSKKRWSNLSKVHGSQERSGQLYTRMNMPSILTTETHSVAIYAGGGSNLVENIVEVIDFHRQYAEKLQAFGLIVDADKKQPKEAAKEKAEGLKSVFPTISNEPGIITAGPPRTGIYVLPNNEDSGVLDSVLVECASTVYPDHKNAADNFLDSLDKDHTKHFSAF